MADQAGVGSPAPWFQLIPVTVGGLLAILGGFLSGLFQARRARRVRMEELIAERKVQANAEGYGKMKHIQGLLIQSEIEFVAKAMQDSEEWFWNNRLFLPARFSDKFLDLRTGVSRAMRLAKQLPKTAEELSTLEGELGRLMEESNQEIYRDRDSSGTLLPNYPCARSEPSVMGTRRSGPTRRPPLTSWPSTSYSFRATLRPGTPFPPSLIRDVASGIIRDVASGVSSKATDQHRSPDRRKRLSPPRTLSQAPTPKR